MQEWLAARSLPLIRHGKLKDKAIIKGKLPEMLGPNITDFEYLNQRDEGICAGHDGAELSVAQDRDFLDALSGGEVAPGIAFDGRQKQGRDCLISRSPRTESRVRQSSPRELDKERCTGHLHQTSLCHGLTTAVRRR